MWPFLLSILKMVIVTNTIGYNNGNENYEKNNIN